MIPKRIKQTLATIFSSLFHPLMMPVYLTLSLLFLPQFSPAIPTRYKTYILIVAVYAFVIFPVGILYALKKLGKLSSIDLKEQKERFLPMLLIAFSYIVGHWFLCRINTPPPLTLLMQGVCLTIIIIALISTVWKISAHTTAIGAALGVVVLLSILYKINLSYVAIAVTLIAGGIGWSRLYLKRHTIKQISYGFLTGFTVMTASFFIRFVL